MTLEARDIHVSVRDHAILKGVSLSIAKGRLVGLIGPNGAGKSSLLRTMLGLMEPASGTILLGGEDLSDWTIKQRAGKISYAAQGAPVHWPLDVRHIISLGRIPCLDPWQKIGEMDRQLVDQAMVRTDTLHLADRLVTTLSGGERACVMLARAIVSGADYLCADEPIASLDPYHQLQVMDILRTLAREGHGVLIVLHDLALAGGYCDELLLMHQGRILASGAVDEVLTPDNLDRAYHIKARQNGENTGPFLSPWQRSGKPRR